MNKAQKEVQQAQLNDEKKVIKLLERVYEQAKKDCEQKIRELSARTDLENLQSIIYQKEYQQIMVDQLDGMLRDLHTGQFTTITDYLEKSYTNGYIGVFYDLQSTGIPLVIPIQQDQVIKALKTDSKLSSDLYTRLGEDVNYLKRSIRAELSRGISSGSSWNEMALRIARGMNSPFNKAINNAIRIARTEGHRIQNEAALDGQNNAKKKGADIVKQWDATLDSRTRPEHREADGQIRELDEPFDIGGEKKQAPGVGGSAKNVCNCRCCLLQRAKWALDEKELETLKERAEFFGLDKTKEFGEFKEKYLSVAKETEKGSYLTSVKRIGTNKVDLDYIRSEGFRKKFNKITTNTAINDALRSYATAMLTHRNGTDGEDLYIIDTDGKLILREISGKNELGVTISKEDSERIRKQNGTIGIHNHPTNIPPTGSDFVAAGYRKYDFGIAVAHSGRVYKYKAGSKPFLPGMLDGRIDKYQNEPYNLSIEEAHTRALNEISKEYGIIWEELK